MIQKSTIRADFLLLIASLAWGYGFVPQKQAMLHLSPLLFNGFRFALGAIVLLPLALSKKTRQSHSLNPINPLSHRNFAIAIFILGFVLFAAATLQQTGMASPNTTATKTAFLTGLYIIFVPIIGILLKHKTHPVTWISAIITFLGVFFLTSENNNNQTHQNLPLLAQGDLLVLLGAIFWAFHLLIIGYLVQITHAFKLACGQFAICSILSFIAAITLNSTFTLQQLTDCIPPILYGGFISAGLGYTLQIIAQKNAPPAHAAIILTLETLFGAIAGYLFLNEILSTPKILGAVLILLGILATQLYPLYRHKKHKSLKTLAATL